MLSIRLRDFQGRGGRHTVGAEAKEDLSSFWTWQDGYTHELSTAVVAYTRPTQSVFYHGMGSLYPKVRSYRQ